MVDWPPTLRERAPFILFPQHWNEIRQLKRKLIKDGYPNQFSYWADFHNQDSTAIKYVRVEVMVKGMISKDQVKWLKDFFTDFPPLLSYAIFTYDAISSTIDFVSGWNE